MRLPAPFSLMLLLSLQIIACSDSTSGDGASTDPLLDIPPMTRQLIFSEGDVANYPWHANIFHWDFTNAVPEPLLFGGAPDTGESGDPAFFQVGNSVLMFNRTSDSQNFRQITQSSEEKKAVVSSGQISFPGQGIGDPHDAISLGDGKILLANYSEGTLTIMDPSGKFISEVSADWDLPPGASFHPEALVQATIGGKSFIFVIHQGMALESGSLKANNSQKVFVLLNESGNISPQKVRTDSSRVSGIDIVGSFPVPLKCIHDNKLVLVSVCSSFTTVSSSGTKCKNAVETVDLSERTATTAWDLDDAGITMNGQVMCGASADQFFMSVNQVIDGASQARMIKAEISAKKITPIYTYGTKLGGYFAAFFDKVSGNLFIGDATDDGHGKLSVFSSDVYQRSIALDLVPYSGVIFEP